MSRTRGRNPRRERVRDACRRPRRRVGRSGAAARGDRHADAGLVTTAPPRSSGRKRLFQRAPACRRWSWASGLVSQRVYQLIDGSKIPKRLPRRISRRGHASGRLTFWAAPALANDALKNRCLMASGAGSDALSPRVGGPPPNERMVKRRTAVLKTRAQLRNPCEEETRTVRYGRRSYEGLTGRGFTRTSNRHRLWVER